MIKTAIKYFFFDFCINTVFDKWIKEIYHSKPFSLSDLKPNDEIAWVEVVDEESGTITTFHNLIVSKTESDRVYFKNNDYLVIFFDQIKNIKMA